MLRAGEWKNLRHRILMPLRIGNGINAAGRWLTPHLVGGYVVLLAAAPSLVRPF
jgi:hypothetical protein